MKVFITLITIALYFNASAQGLQAYFDYGSFYSPESKNYVETYLTFVGNSMELKLNENGELQGRVEVSYSFYQKDSLMFDTKYQLAGFASKDTLKAQSNFIDMQRIPLTEGDYKMLLRIKDLNTDKEAYELIENFSLKTKSDSIDFSHIEFVAGLTETTQTNILTKSGYDVTPYTNDFFPQNMNRLKFYLEVYNTKAVLGDSSMYLLEYYIQNSDSEMKVKSTSRPSRKKAEDINVLFGTLNLETVPSGNYKVVVEVRNRNNELIAKHQRSFQRSNPGVSLSNEDLGSIDVSSTFVEEMKSIDTLTEAIKCLRPISDLQEIQFADNQLERADRVLMQQYFLNFWKRRFPHSPEEAWLKYKEQVDLVHRLYGTRSMKGYQTDRGRVYLKYGKPSSVRNFDVMRGKPYEIWQYYRVGKQSNIKFVFVNENPSTNIYRLRHSDAVGEPSDPTWRAKVNLIDLDNVNQNGELGGQELNGE